MDSKRSIGSIQVGQMSRASDLRDAVANAIQNALPTANVQTTVVANYAPEDLDDPVIAVRVARRVITVEMGPSSRLVDIEIAIMARNPAQSGFPTDAKAEYRAVEIAAADTHDDLVESIIALWTPATVLAREQLSGHRLNELTQEVALDVPTYYENGLYFTTITIQFFDQLDED